MASVDSPGRAQAVQILQRSLEGGHWMLTPPRLLTLVHAVQQPIGRPAFASNTTTRLSCSFSPKSSSTSEPA